MAKNEELDALKQRTLSFIMKYKPNEVPPEVTVTLTGGDQYFVLYGFDVRSGIVGFGDTPEGAFNDFVDNWEFYSKRSKKKYSSA